MIIGLSAFITEALLKSGIIENADKELYTYGFYIVLSQGMVFITTVLFGLILETLWESVVFYIMFSLIRCFAGGFHAAEEGACSSCTIIALFLSTLSLSLLERGGSVETPLGMLVFGSIIVYLFSPLEAEGKPLSVEEKSDYRRKSLGITFSFFIVSLYGWIIHIPGLLYASAVSQTLESFLLILGKIHCSAKHSVN